MADKEIDVLFIEDNLGDAKLIQLMLMEAAPNLVSLTHTQTLQQGFEMMQQVEYDVILLDLSLPDSFGIDTLLKLVAREPDVAIVVLTGVDAEELGIQAVQMGAQDYLLKGDVDSRLLMRSIRYALERRQISTALRRSEEVYRSLIDDVFDTSLVAVLILDSDFHVVWCNRATEIYFGIPRERLLGRDKRMLIETSLKNIFADPEDYASRLLQSYNDSLFNDRFECHVVEMGGFRKERWLEHWSQPIRDGMYASGRIEQYTDITNRKTLEFAEQEQRQFAEALRGIAALLTSTLELDDVLGRIISNLGRVLSHDLAIIVMLENDNIRIARQLENGELDIHFVSGGELLISEFRHYFMQILDAGEGILNGDLPSNAPVWVTSTAPDEMRAYITVPIQLQRQIIGFVNVFSETPNYFLGQHTERLSAFAELSAIAIQNARLYQQSQELAALEERQRLARELHDSVSQTLFTCQTMAETALRRLDRDPQRAGELLEEVYRLTKTALTEMRLLLLELRPAALTQVSLKELFEQYFRPVQARQQFELELSIDEIPPLVPDVQLALYRIAQEALNNINRHAQATHVVVRVMDFADRIELDIEDDGRGFEMDHVGPTSMGLGVMRERAEGIGAAIDIDSRVNEGTRISIIWYRYEGGMV